MGAGIAQVAAMAGHPVLIYDVAEGAAGRAVSSVRERIARLIAKGRLDIDPAGLRLVAASHLADLAPARCVIEAIAEDLAVKQALFAQLEAIVAADCVLATNTSSLSPTAVAAGLSYPGRLVGLHFFNPAPLMRLVEVVSGLATRPEVAATPGFIVNRVARPYYAEALRLAEEQVATPATIDAVLTQGGGFKMGPFALMDLGRGWFHYGDDVTVVEPGAAPARPAPPYVTEGGVSPLRTLLNRSDIEIRAAADDGGTLELPSGARLVRSDGRPATRLAAGWAVPVVVVDRTLDDAAATGIAMAASEDCPAAAIDEATGLLQAAGLSVYLIDDAPGLVVTRTVAMLVNGVIDAMHKGVASASDIDTAMRLGTNYPAGPLAWGQSWGPAVILAVLEAMQGWYGEDRYRPSPLLRRIVIAGGSLVPGTKEKT
jgi:3-hydroxybutyryl-CoA dehydrogenase